MNNSAGFNHEPLASSEVEATIAEIATLDNELLLNPDCRKLIELGAQFGAEITNLYGTPSHPKWCSGTVETDVFMSYHNGGADGHTSVGPKGYGVPRNVLLIANSVNLQAGREVLSPIVRAIAFYASEAHDYQQLCGRSLLPEGNGKNHGDEKISANEAKNRYIASGGSQALAQQVFDNVMATAFNPISGSQNVNYDQWKINPTDTATIEAVLGQELTASADLLSLSTPRGVLGSIEYYIESMCLGSKNRLIQHRLYSLGINLGHIDSMENMLGIISSDSLLNEEFTQVLSSNSKFLSEVKYADQLIKMSCGKGIDELFPHRRKNSNSLLSLAKSLKAGATPFQIWMQAKELAGY